MLATCDPPPQAFRRFVFPACLLSFALLPFVGQDFFPSVDSGEFKLHMRAPTGTRIEETAELCEPGRRRYPETDSPVRTDRESSTTSGCRTAALNLAYSTSAPIGPGRRRYPGGTAPKHRPTAEYVSELRAKLARIFRE